MHTVRARAGALPSVSKSAGMQTLNTPPYSSDFRPCELIFTVFKARLRRLGAFHRRGETPEAGLGRIMQDICTLKLVRKSFRACGLV
jgi:hypothetical protein